jgi:hypothetical protein
MKRILFRFLKQCSHDVFYAAVSGRRYVPADPCLEFQSY